MTCPVYHKGARNRSVYFPGLNSVVAAREAGGAGGGCASWTQYLPAGGGAGMAISYKPGQRALIQVPFDELAMFECIPATMDGY